MRINLLHRLPSFKKGHGVPIIYYFILIIVLYLNTYEVKNILEKSFSINSETSESNYLLTNAM